jgi:hypothetical protein
MLARVPDVNPYAPPRAHDPNAVTQLPPPPEGIRRYTVDPEGTRRALRRRLGRLFLLMVVVLGVQTALTARDLFGVAFPIFALGALWGFMQWRQRAIVARAVAQYELVAGPRVLRRTSVVGVAEILGSNVREIRETKLVLYLFSSVARECFVVPRFLLGYEDLRSQVSARCPIGPMGAWEAFWRRPLMRLRMEIDPRVIAADPTLADEVALVRASCQFHPKPSRRLRRILILWFVLMAMFFAIWQFLAPTDATRAREKAVHQRDSASPP